MPDLCRLGGAQVPLEDAFEWSGSRSIMDVGGGRGEMLARCMACAGPQCRGILMDRPWVLDRRAPPSCPSSGLSWPCLGRWFALALASRVASKWLLCCCWSIIRHAAVCVIHHRFPLVLVLCCLSKGSLVKLATCGSGARDVLRS